MCYDTAPVSTAVVADFLVGEEMEVALKAGMVGKVVRAVVMVGMVGMVKVMVVGKVVVVEILEGTAVESCSKDTTCSRRTCRSAQSHRRFPWQETNGCKIFLSC